VAGRGVVLGGGAFLSGGEARWETRWETQWEILCNRVGEMRNAVQRV
jgi:hypothetical protein